MGQGADVGATLRGYRARFSIKQDALARALDVSQGQLSRWESGRERPGARNRDVIDALIHGRADPLLAGLINYVRGARAPLALFDARLAIVAAQKPRNRCRQGARTRQPALCAPCLNRSDSSPHASALIARASASVISVCTCHPSPVCGKSVRKCPPRLSVRLSAAAATSVADVTMLR